MIKFRRPTVNDRQWVTDYVNKGITDGSSYSFGSIFAWGSAYGIEIADYNGFLLVQGTDKRGRYYAYPSGSGDIKVVINDLLEECRTQGRIFRFEQLLPSCKSEIEELIPDTFEFTYDRDNCEYVYSIQNMAELPGKQFHGKRGHVKSFFNKYHDITCDPITDDNIADCMAIENAWLSEKDDDDGALAMEHKAIEVALNNFNQLDFVGAVLYVSDKPVAFTMGEKIKNNTFCTHYEKTVPEFRDAFPVINNGFT